MMRWPTFNVNPWLFMSENAGQTKTDHQIPIVQFSFSLKNVIFQMLAMKVIGSLSNLGLPSVKKISSTAKMPGISMDQLLSLKHTWLGFIFRKACMIRKSLCRRRWIQSSWMEFSGTKWGRRHWGGIKPAQKVAKCNIFILYECSPLLINYHSFSTMSSHQWSPVPTTHYIVIIISITCPILYMYHVHIHCLFRCWKYKFCGRLELDIIWHFTEVPCKMSTIQGVVNFQGGVTIWRGW